MEIRKVAHAFDVQVKRTKRVIKGVYRVDRKNGESFALKTMAYPTAQLRWIDATLQRLRDSGFTKISWRDPTQAEGKRLFIQYKGTKYILTPWIEGRWPSPESPTDMRECGASLACLHKMSVISQGQQVRMNMIGEWPSELRQKHFTLIKHLNISRRVQYPDRFHLFVRRYSHEILSFSKQSLSLLQNSNYREECRRAKPHICHGDGGPTNFIINTNGTYLIDFETLRIDLPSYDLYRVIYNSCKDHQWNFRIAHAILEGYQTKVPLTPAHVKLARVWLRFPRTTVLLLNKYYRSSSRDVRRHISAKMPAALVSERRVTSFLKELEQYENMLATQIKK